MKNKLIKAAVLLSIIMTSCDRYYYNQLYIINNCNEAIYISITDTWDNEDTFSVDANTTVMFNEGEGIATPKTIVEQSFVKFEVTKNGIKSKVNYRDFNRWTYVEKEDKYHSELYLLVNPEDFE
jgi:ribosomal protein L21